MNYVSSLSWGIHNSISKENFRVRGIDAINFILRVTLKLNVTLKVLKLWKLEL